MAIENITVTDGESTADVATDVVGTDHFQVVKIALGADGALDNIVDAGAQTSAASIPVVLASDHADVKITLDSEAVAVTNADITSCKTALEIIDDWDASDHCNIRHLNATDDIVQLGAGTASIGKLGTANSGVDIGDVDVTSVVPGTGATNLGKAEDAGHSSGDVGVMALAVRTDTPAASSGTTADYEPLHTNKLGSLWVQRQGATPYKNIDVDESEDAVSANPCVVTGFYAYNNAAAGTKRYLKFYNDTVANVAVGTTTPVFVVELDGVQGISWATPLLFSAACTIAATTGVADNDTGAPSANDVVFSCGYNDL